MHEEKLKKIKSKIFITDDISNMKAITTYRDNLGISNAQLVVSAFKAGHDLILISHLNQHSKNNFKVSDLYEAVEALAEYCSTPSGLNLLKTSLDKILKFKEKVGSISSGDKLAKTLGGVLKRTEYSNVSQFKQAVFDEGLLNINKFKLDKFSLFENATNNKSITILGGGKYIDVMERYFPENNNFKYFRKESIYQKEGDYSKFKNAIKKEIEGSKYFVYLVDDDNDFNAVEWLRLNNVDTSSVLLFVQGDISKLSSESVSGFTVLSNFSKDKDAVLSLIKVLKGDIIPNSLTNSPVEINNGAYFDLKNRSMPIIGERVTEKQINLINRSKTGGEPSILSKLMYFLLLTPLVIVMVSCTASYASSNLYYKDGKEVTKSKFIVDAYFKGFKEYKIRTGLSLIFSVAIVLFICFGNMPSSFIEGRLAGNFDEGTISVVMYLIDMFASFARFLASFG